MRMAAEKRIRKTGWLSRWPLWVSLALFLILLGFALAGQVSSGQVMLPEEDAYQRLALARNLAGRFAWEIIPGQFTSAFGTLLWPVLLAPVFLLLGASALWAWILNAVLSVVLIVLAYRAVRGAVADPAAQAVLLAVLVVALPLVPLAASGMEQVLFLVLLLVFLELWSRRMQSAARAGLVPMAIVAALLASTRYEGMLLVAVAALFLLLKRDFAAGLIAPCAAALPLAAYGLISWRVGWLPVPASVYLRRAELVPSDLSALPSVVFRSLDVLGVNPDLRAVVLLLTLLPAWLGFTNKLSSVREREFFGPALAVLAILADLTLVGNRGYRYDAWLVMLGFWAVLPLLGKILPADLRELKKNSVTLLAGAGLAVLLGFPLVNRGVQGAILFGQSAERAKWIQRLAADWAADCAAGPLATDSPGTIVFLAGRSDVVDLSGFVSLGAFRERRGGNLSAEWMRAEAERSGARAAVIFQAGDQMLAERIWPMAGGWIQSECAQCDSAEIFRLQEDSELSRCTESFLSNLPSDKTIRKPERGGSE
jgi:hypothetical protein